MKKIALLFIVCLTAFTSCSLDDNNQSDFYLEVMPIDSVEVPEHFLHGHTYQISVTYTKPSDCYYFNDFIYEVDGNQRTIAVVNSVYSSDTANCDVDPQQVTVHFNFMVTANQTYVFKFYQGEDEDGVDQYYLIEIPVLDERPNNNHTEKD